MVKGFKLILEIKYKYYDLKIKKLNYKKNNNN